jgi:hypothetical protein
LQTYIGFEDWTTFVQSVKRAGITNVLIFDKQNVPGRHGFSFRAGANEYPFCRRLADEYGMKLAQFGNLQLYQVWPERADEPSVR